MDYRNQQSCELSQKAKLCQWLKIIINRSLKSILFLRNVKLIFVCVFPSNSFIARNNLDVPHTLSLSIYFFIVCYLTCIPGQDTWLLTQEMDFFIFNEQHKRFSQEAIYSKSLSFIVSCSTWTKIQLVSFLTAIHVFVQNIKQDCAHF